MSGTKHCVSLSPACPLGLRSASTNRVLGGGVCKALPRTPSALLCFDFSLQLEAIGCSRARLPAGLTSRRGALFSRRLAERGEDLQAVFGNLNLALRDDAKRGPNRKVGEVSARAARRLRSRRKIIAQESGAGGVVLRTPRLRAQDFSKRDEAQGGSRGTGTR